MHIMDYGDIEGKEILRVAFSFVMMGTNVAPKVSHYVVLLA